LANKSVVELLVKTIDAYLSAHLFERHQLFFFAILDIGNEITKMVANAATIVGPEGVSNSNEKYIPIMTEMVPIKQAIMAIISGDFES